MTTLTGLPLVVTTNLKGTPCRPAAYSITHVHSPSQDSSTSSPSKPPTTSLSPQELTANNFTSHITEKLEQSEEFEQVSTITPARLSAFLPMRFPCPLVALGGLSVCYLKPTLPFSTRSHPLTPTQGYSFSTSFLPLEPPCKHDVTSSIKNTNKQLPLTTHLSQTAAPFLFPFTNSFRWLSLCPLSPSFLLSFPEHIPRRLVLPPFTWNSSCQRHP